MAYLNPYPYQDHAEASEGKKESKNKLNWSYLPVETLEGVVRVFEKGAIKYEGIRTWLPGIKFSKLFAAIMRHLIDWFFWHKDKDDESGEHPLCHVIANCLMLLTYIENEKYDDRRKINEINKARPQDSFYLPKTFRNN